MVPRSVSVGVYTNLPDGNPFVKPGPVYYSRGRKGTQAMVPLSERVPREPLNARKARALRQLAEKAGYYIKPVKPEIEEIRKILTENGIASDNVIENLGGGLALIQRVGHSMLSENGRRLLRKDPEGYLRKYMQLVAKIHNLGITHGDLQPKNIIILPDASLGVTDLELAEKHDLKKPASSTPSWTEGRLESDLARASAYLAKLLRQIHVPGVRTNENARDLALRIAKDIFKLHSAPVRERIKRTPFLARTAEHFPNSQ